MRTTILFVCMILMGVSIDASAQNYKDSINGNWVIEGLKIGNNDTLVSLAIEDTFCVKLKPVFKPSIMDSEEVTEEQFEMVWTMTCGMLYNIFSQIELKIDNDRFVLNAATPGGSNTEKGTITPVVGSAGIFTLKNDTKPGDQQLTFKNGRIHMKGPSNEGDGMPEIIIVMKKK